MRVGQTRKRDTNEATIVAALQAVGVLVWRISAPGLPDLLTHYRGIWRPLEIKSTGNGRRPTVTRAKQLLTPQQREVYAKAPFPIVTSVDEAYLAVGLVRRGLTRPYVAWED